MKQLVRIPFFLIFWCTTLAALAQSSGTGIGQWRVYPPNRNAVSVASTGDRIYCATETGFYYLDKQFNSLHNLSKIDGLHDIGISTIKYDSVTATLVVAYQNTNLDLIRGDQIININDIVRKTISGGKAINHIYFANKLAYLSCSFGLVVLDLVKLEIRDSYIFQSANGTSLQVYAATTLRDQIYIATSNGVMSAMNLRTVNLNDLKNWKAHGPADGLDASFLPGSIKTIAAFNGAVYAGANQLGVMKYDGTTWRYAVTILGGVINSLIPGRNALIISNQFNVILHPGAGADDYRDNAALLAKPLETIQDRDGTLWTADYANGLVRHNGKDYESIIPNGPAYVGAFSLFADRHSLLVAGGGYRRNTQFDSEAGFYEFKNGTWESFNYLRFNDPAVYPKIRDLTDVVRNPVNGKVYFASYGFGLIEWNGPGDFLIHTLGNSPLNSSVIGSPEFVRLTSIAPDEAGNLWVVNPSNFSGLPGLHVLRPDNTWQTFSMQGTQTGSFGNSNIFQKIIIDNNGYKWISLNGSNGLLVFDDVNNRFRLFNRSATTGDLPGNEVISLAKDNKGEIWIGTENGIGVFFDPEFAFASKSISAVTPVIGRRPLLEGQAVKVITVDGANRKWVGTDNGLWLFSESGEEVIYNFTTRNSPLPSDRITDIAINPASGDVFISTESGLASFRAGATVTTEKLNCSNVFPNPVRPGYTGEIAISGVSNNASVKITDVTGTLVFQTRALGGTAIWNGRDNRGNRVRSGVYLVLSSNGEGTETCVSKVAVIE